MLMCVCVCDVIVRVLPPTQCGLNVSLELVVGQPQQEARLSRSCVSSENQTVH